MTSRHIGVWIDAAPEVVYAIGADPQQLPRWASGLAEGRLDHVVRLPSGEAVYNPLRVIPAGEGQAGCEVVFTVRRRPGMTDEEFESDAATVAADLDRLRRLAEG